MKQGVWGKIWNFAGKKKQDGGERRRGQTIKSAYYYYILEIVKKGTSSFCFFSVISMMSIWNNIAIQKLKKNLQETR